MCTLLLHLTNTFVRQKCVEIGEFKLHVPVYMVRKILRPLTSWREKVASLNLAVFQLFTETVKTGGCMEGRSGVPNFISCFISNPLL